MMQDRIGPNRAAVLGWRGWGIPHFVADALKMIFKEDFVPAKANKFLFTLAPLMAIVPVFVTFAIVPFGATACWSQMANVVTDAQVAACSDKIVLQMRPASTSASSSTSRSLRSPSTAPRSPAGPRTTSGRCSAACAPRPR